MYNKVKWLPCPLLKKLRIAFMYTELRIDIFKDAVSLPGVSMQYLLLGTLNQRDAPELYAPGPKAYKMLKGAVVGGPSLMFSRMQEAGLTRIHSQKYEDAKLCRKVLGYNANALYPITMLGEMPFSREEVYYWPLTEKGLKSFLSGLRQDRWFGFAEVDIRSQQNCSPLSKKCRRSFCNKPVLSEAVPQHMKDCLAQSNSKPMHDQQ